MKRTFVSLIFFFIGLVTAGCGKPKKDEHSYISSVDSFLTAINKGEETIYIDDISFDSEYVISLNYPLKLIGKENKSRLSNVCFYLKGINVIGEQTKYCFNNIIFDGCIDIKNYDFSTPKKAFSEIFNDDRTNSNCFKISEGYVDLNLNNCDVTRYASYNGPAIYVDNNSAYREHNRTITIDNCSFYKNITYSGTLFIGHDKGITNISNSVFRDNLAKFAGGIGIGNGKVNIQNVDVCDNDFYHFLNENRNDDMISGKYNYTNQVGSLFVGGSDAYVSNCVVSNNKGLFGAGIGFTTPEAKIDGQRIFFKDIVIKDNEADCGGAIYAKVGEGNIVKFINCTILNNKAKKGAIVYATPRVPWMSANSGTVDFVFCTMANNISKEENPAFDFYELKKTDALRSIEMHGSFVIDKAPYLDQETNYVADKETAISEGVITQEDLDNCSTKGIAPKKGSKADKVITLDIFKAWDPVFENETKNRSIGSAIEVTTTNNKTSLVVIIVTCCIAVLIGIGLLVFYFIRRKKIQIEKKDIDEKIAKYSVEELLVIITDKLSPYSLTKKELEVTAYLLVCNKRKELAEKLFVSEDTAKTHISHIFKKLKISSKQQLKEVVKKYL